MFVPELINRDSWLAAPCSHRQLLPPLSNLDLISTSLWLHSFWAHDKKKKFKKRVVHPPAVCSILKLILSQNATISRWRMKDRKGSQISRLSHSNQIEFILRLMFFQCKAPAHWKVINSDETGLLWSREIGSNLNQLLSQRIFFFFFFFYQLILSLAANWRRWISSSLRK